MASACVTYDPYPEFGGASADGSTIIYAGSSGQQFGVQPSAKIVIGWQGGLSYFELGTVPLAVGTVSPTTGSAGATIQLRGSGFVAGTAAKIGGQTTACTQIDSETLTCTVPILPSASIALTNPDGQAYSFENAFVVQ